MGNLVQQYSEDNTEVVVLQNEQMTARIAVTLGNTLFSLTANDREYLYFPYTLQEYRESPKLAGNPFMHPWANRLADDSIQVSGTRHLFPESSKQLIYRDGNGLPLHGLLLKSDAWKTTALYANENESCHEAELLFDRAEWHTVFPFAHVIRMCHRLQGNALHVEVTIDNKSGQSMPVSFGFHPYFFKNKEDMQLSLPAEEVLLTDEKQIPDGQKSPKENYWPFENHRISLSSAVFDHGFTGLPFATQKIVTYHLDDVALEVDAQYPFVQVYAPAGPGKPYVCIEPMTAATNALQLAGECPAVAAEAIFSATFTIRINA